MNHKCTANQAAVGVADCDLLITAYILAGLAMMLNIRLSYSSAPYALIRFRLPENLFSVFVRRMASALELWCLPSMLMGNFMDLIQKLALNTVIDENLKKAAGTSSGEADKLRALALALYQKAEALNTAVTNPGGNDEAAKVLRHKAITLLGLAANLYEAANALKLAAGAGAGAGQQEAGDLVTAVGENETSGGIRLKLKQLADATSTLTAEAGAVTDAYSNSSSGGVKDKFGKVQEKEGNYESAGHKPLYDAVVYAMTAFDNVYKPEEQLVSAVGDSAEENSGLQKELKALGNHDEAAAAGQLPNLVKAVKDKYRDEFGSNVNAKFNAVVAQASAYKAGGKTTYYEGLLQAWTNFNDKYYGVVSNYKYYIIIVSSIITQWLNFLTYVVLLFVYVMGGDTGHLTVFYFVIAISGVVFGINMVLVYAQDDDGTITYYMIGENSFPIITSFIHYLTTLMFGNRRRWNSDFIVVCVDIVVAIIISLVAAAVWTWAYVCKIKYGSATDKDASSWHHIFTHGFEGEFHPEVISPFLMIVVGMGLVYAIYPGIAPGMIVPFYLIDKIEMILLIATAVPPVIVAILKSKYYGPFVWLGNWGGQHTGDGGTCTIAGQNKTWQPDTSGMPAWHLCDVFVIIMITLAYIFIYSLHYKESKLSRSIINQPKMSTFLSILFYMSHEISLAVGFPGIASDAEVLLPTQLIGAFLMVLLAPYSEGYIIEYKSHDPAHWPTEGMTKWNAFCYWCKRASKITNHNLRSLFTTDLRRDLLLCIQKNELI